MNPGVVYLCGVGILYFITDKVRYYLAVLISVLAVGLIYNLSTAQQLVVPFLDFELVLLKVTPVSKLIGLVFALFGLGSTIYSFPVADKKYYLLSQIYIGSSVAILFVGDLFSFYVLWELMTISSYFLIFTNQQPITRQTSYYYFVMQLVGALSLLWGILIQYTATGSLALTAVEYGLPFFLLAVGIKLAFIGLHTWLPKNYAVVPFQISVLLSAYTTKVGVYTLYRLLSGVELLGYAGVVTAILGVLLALKQTQVRRLLSYHIISQIGYMIVGIGVGTSLGQLGGLLHLVNNVLYKGLLFMVIGVVIYTTEQEDLVELGGLAKKLPVTTCFAVVAALSIAGIPLFSGHISKLLIKKGIKDPVLNWGLYLAGIGTSLSFLKVVYYGFIRSPEEEITLQRKPSKAMLWGMGLLTSLIVLIGTQPELITSLVTTKVKVDYFSFYYLQKSLQPTLLALLIFKLASDLIEPHPHATTEFDLYPYLGQGVDYLGAQLSRLHNGDLSRYLLWLVTTLVALWVKLY
ncbi:proton-conducting transporter transmembrane domain-containing protein [Halanaerobaculum tunisiense]